MRGTRLLRSFAPCRLPGGTAARAAPPYYPLFLGLLRDGESHPRGCLGGRVTKVTLAPPTRPRLRAVAGSRQSYTIGLIPLLPGSLAIFAA